MEFFLYKESWWSVFYFLRNFGYRYWVDVRVKRSFGMVKVVFVGVVG